MHLSNLKNTRLFRNESSHKFAKLGNVTTRTLVIFAALIMCIMYITYVGVSASQSSTTDSLAGNTTATCRVFCTSTTTTTSTTYVCCQTVTATVTTTPTTTTFTVNQPTVTTTSVSTVTAAANVMSGDGSSGFQNSFYCNTFLSNSVDCQVTVSLTTQGFAVDGVTTLLVLSYKNAEGD